jgi:hypothetical protein
VDGATNTTAVVLMSGAVFMFALDGPIALIALPAIFRGVRIIHSRQAMLPGSGGSG